MTIHELDKIVSKTSTAYDTMIYDCIVFYHIRTFFS